MRGNGLSGRDRPDVSACAWQKMTLGSLQREKGSGSHLKMVLTRAVEYQVTGTRLVTSDYVKYQVTGILLVDGDRSVAISAVVLAIVAVLGLVM